MLPNQSILVLLYLQFRKVPLDKLCLGISRAVQKWNVKRSNSYFEQIKLNKVIPLILIIISYFIFKIFAYQQFVLWV